MNKNAFLATLFKIKSACTGLRNLFQANHNGFKQLINCNSLYQKYDRSVIAAETSEKTLIQTTEDLKYIDIAFKTDKQLGHKNWLLLLII